MGADTGISWCDSTWNPIRGCSRVSAGCVNCYAETMAHRFSGEGQPYAGLVDANGRWNGTIRTAPEHLEDPIRWQRPRRVFVNSMSDLFHPNLEEREIHKVFGVMALTPRHRFQVLTKRVEEAILYFGPRLLSGVEEDVAAEAEFLARRTLDGFTWDSRGSSTHLYRATVDPTGKRRSLAERVKHRRPWPGWPLPNVWIGASVEDQRVAHRVDLLRKVPAAIRFLSIEPMIGPLEVDLTGIDWIILGGESGPGARPCDPAWFRPLITEARRVGARVFVKQLGSVWARANRWADVISLERVGFDLKGGHPEIWPEDLQIQEFPA